MLRFKSFFLIFSVIALCVYSGLFINFDMNFSKNSAQVNWVRSVFDYYGEKSSLTSSYDNSNTSKQGYIASRWAIANMYALGDGAPKNSFQAFKIYIEIANQGIEPGSSDTVFFIDSLLALADYYRHGIKNSPVGIDLFRARQIYFQLASVFGVPEAQFQFSKMLLSGEGGDVDIQQAKKWLYQARKRGHIKAIALFGNILFQEGQISRGLAYMTAAVVRCRSESCLWIQSLQKHALATANEEDRRIAMVLANDVNIEYKEK
ncbi:exopolysaccharide production negative regulator [Liberibacter crescens]|nr:exopolysaccharide production negative regulator [Liberibacter crescens]